MHQKRKLLIIKEIYITKLTRKLRTEKSHQNISGRKPMHRSSLFWFECALKTPFKREPVGW